MGIGRYPLGSDEEGTLQNFIAGRINGSFKGWTGRTRYQLLTGEVWEQRSFNCIYRYSYMPRVLILQTEGGYRMRVDGVPGWVPVKRVM